ncbi:uncharacterized protein [Bos taurus]|uniref:uncharacterized protein n=1 Tax=Bos taurus TaxID=9913 RepID=UPI0028CB8147|nr:uncharacterized protein LOC132343743 [Bos taurus]
MMPENGGTDDVDGVKRVDYSGKEQGCIWSNCACTVKAETVPETIQYILGEYYRSQDSYCSTKNVDEIQGHHWQKQTWKLENGAIFSERYAISLKRSCMDSRVAEIGRMLWQSQYVGLSAVIFEAFVNSKESSMVDTHHNQLAKCPNDTVCSQNVLTIKYKSKHFVPKREVSRAHTRRLTRSWSFQKNLSVLPRKNVSWQSMPSRRETRRTLEINGFGSCYECSPQISLPRPASQEQRSEQQGSSQPSHGIVTATVLSGNAGDCDIARAQRSHVSAKNCNRKWGPVAPSSEVSEEARTLTRNAAFLTTLEGRSPNDHPHHHESSSSNSVQLSGTVVNLNAFKTCASSEVLYRFSNSLFLNCDGKNILLFSC